MIQVGSLFLLCIAAVTAQAPPPPAPAPPAPAKAPIQRVPCVDDVIPANNFDPTQFAGTWYDVRKFFPYPGRNGTCEAVKYTPNKDGTIKVDVGWVDTKNQTQQLTGTIELAGTNPTDAKLNVTLKKKSLIYTIFYLVYDRFFGVYACVGNKADVWIFARKQEVEDLDLRGSIYTVMQSKYPNLSTMLFFESTQTGCPAVV